MTGPVNGEAVLAGLVNGRAVRPCQWGRDPGWLGQPRERSWLARSTGERTRPARSTLGWSSQRNGGGGPGRPGQPGGAVLASPLDRGRYGLATSTANKSWTEVVLACTINGAASAGSVDEAAVLAGTVNAGAVLAGPVNGGACNVMALVCRSHRTVGTVGFVCRSRRALTASACKT